jgi:hypothetical protein
MMVKMYIISIMRKGATKPTVASCQEGNYLSLIQILESTDDVESYEVVEMGDFFQIRDLWLPPMEGRNPWKKWQPVKKADA